MIKLTTQAWSGNAPGYGAIVPSKWVIALPPTKMVVFSNGTKIATKETVNWICLSPSGSKWAYQGVETGLIYENNVSTGVKGYGQFSFLYVGETLKSFSDKETFQSTSGGWAYVDEQGKVVPYGSKYSGPPLWVHTDFHDVSIGQGPENDDGVCVAFPGDPKVRQLVAGNCFNIRVARDGDTFYILAVNYKDHHTDAWKITLAELKQLPLLQMQPSPQPQPEPKPVPRPNHFTIVDGFCKAAAAKFPVGPDRGWYVLNKVCQALNSEGYGLIAKTTGNNYKGYSTDKIIQKDGTGVDILTGANNDEPSWSEITPTDPASWRPAVDVDGSTPSPNPNPVPEPQPVPTTDLKPVLEKLDAQAAVIIALTSVVQQLSNTVNQLSGALQAVDVDVNRQRPVQVKGSVFGLSVTLNGQVG